MHPLTGSCCYCCPCHGQQEDFLFFNHFELRGTERHEPTPHSPLHGCQHLKLWVSYLPFQVLVQAGQSFRLSSLPNGWAKSFGGEPYKGRSRPQEWRSALPVLAQQVWAHWSAL